MLTESDRKWIEDKCGSVDITFLYIMVFLTMMHSCSLENTDTTEIETRLSSIEKTLNIEAQYGQ